MINLHSNKVQIKHFLKADSYNEDYTIIRNDVGSNSVKIVNGNEEFFENIILKYNEQQNNKYYIKILTAHDELIYSENLEKWIKNNIIDSENDIIIYVEGYAGCGKTTWVQSILHTHDPLYYYLLSNNDMADNITQKFQGIYNDFYRSFTNGAEYSSDVIRFNIVNSIVVRMLFWLEKDEGLDILDDFCKLLSDTEIGKLSNRIPNISKPFKKSIFNNEEKKETYFYKNAKHVRDNPEAKENFIDIFRENINERINGTDKFIFSISDVLCIDYIWRIAQINNINKNTERIFVCYDNLDVIEDFQALADFINELENFKTNISNFRNEYEGELKIPYFTIFTTCRNITSAKLNANGLWIPSIKIKEEAIKSDSNEASERNQRKSNVIKIDLSHLYSYEKMMKKRAYYFANHLEKMVDNRDVEKLKNMLDNVLKLPEGAFNEINYSGLWNHNLRACNNVLNRIIYDYPQYYDSLVKEYNTQIKNKYEDSISANTSILLHLIIKILNNDTGWAESLGYRDNKLTTMSRIILTYLYNKKMQGFEIVSLLDFINEFSKVNIDIVEDQNDELSNIKYLCIILQNMLNRLPNEEEELWRRPLYYKRKALTCKNNDISEKLVEQYSEKINKEDFTSFIISDEGSTFIEKIIPQFEFYSARLNKTSIPLYCVITPKDLFYNITRVYNKVAECCDHQITFMKKYMESYNIDMITDYLNKDFHPITIGGNKQLHIIRVIFSHIWFLNSFREYLYHNNDKRFGLFNEIIVMYIYLYLELYDNKFYDVMRNTIGEYNNEVWEEIVLKCNEAIVALKMDAKNGYGSSIVRTKKKNHISFNQASNSKPKLEEYHFNVNKF